MGKGPSRVPERHVAVRIRAPEGFEERRAAPQMGQDRILTDWDSEAAARFGREPIRLRHNLDRHPLFAMEALAGLIEAYPRRHYSLVETGTPGGARLWREGDLGGLSGVAAIEAIRQGRMWLNLRNLSLVDARYAALLDQIIAELGAQLPGFAPQRRNCGLLISSPTAEVYYHADLPGQALLQIAGRKRVHVYPAEPPFVTAEDLEDIALFDLEVGLRYEPSYDLAAEVYDFLPGQMLHWPLNAPHRIENLGTLNISLTISYQTEEIRRLGVVNLANAILRHRFGLKPGSRAISGPAYWAKAVLQKAMRNGGWVKAARAHRRAMDFRLDAAHSATAIETKEAA